MLLDTGSHAKMMMSKPTCETCCFRAKRYCFRYPPQVIVWDATEHSIFPEIMDTYEWQGEVKEAYEWCGEHVPKELSEQDV